MEIEIFKFRSRRDFSAIYVCEHCGYREEGKGYNDDNFHRNVIPKMVCGLCGKTAGSGYEPLATKYAPHEVI